MKFSRCKSYTGGVIRTYEWLREQATYEMRDTEVVH